MIIEERESCLFLMILYASCFHDICFVVVVGRHRCLLLNCLWVVVVLPLSLMTDRQTDTRVLCSMYTYVLVEKKSLLILTKKIFLDDGR